MLTGIEYEYKDGTADANLLRKQYFLDWHNETSVGVYTAVNSTDTKIVAKHAELLIESGAGQVELGLHPDILAKINDAVSSTGIAADSLRLGGELPAFYAPQSTTWTITQVQDHVSTEVDAAVALLTNNPDADMNSIQELVDAVGANLGSLGTKVSYTEAQSLSNAQKDIVWNNIGIPLSAVFTDTIYSKPANESINYITGLQTALDSKANKTGDIFTGDVTIQNAKLLFNALTTGDTQAINATTSLLSFGNTSTQTSIESASDPDTNIGGTRYVLWSANNFDPASKLDATAKAVDSELLDGFNHDAFAKLANQNTFADFQTIVQAGSTPLRLERTGTPTNLNIEFKHPSATKYFGINTAGEFLFGSSMDLANTGTKVYHEGNLDPSTFLTSLPVHTHTISDVTNLSTELANRARKDIAETFANNVTINRQLIGGIGAHSTGGTIDWDHISNSRSGSGYSLLRGNDTNGPDGADATYFHPFSFEYASKDGTGNLTQFAIPYISSSSTGIYYRSKYNDAWVGWAKLWDSQNFNPASYVLKTDTSVTVINDAVVRRNASGTVFANYFSSDGIKTDIATANIGGFAVRNAANDGYIYGATLTDVQEALGVNTKIDRDGSVAMTNALISTSQNIVTSQWSGYKGWTTQRQSNNLVFYPSTLINNAVWDTANHITFTDSGQIITKDGNSTDWSTAFSWGDHGSAGYLTSLPTHNHDDLYYTQSNLDTKFGAKLGAVFNSYWGMTTPSGDSSSWIRTTTSGIIPHTSGGASSVGSSAWNFSTVYGATLYENNTRLEDKYVQTSNIGNLVNNTGIGYIMSKTYDAVVGQTGTNKWTIKDPETDADVLSTTTVIALRVRLVTQGTGAHTGSSYLLQNIDGEGWEVHTIAENSRTDTFPYVFVDNDDLPKVTLQHASDYTVKVYIDKIYLHDQDGTFNIFGADSILSLEENIAKFRTIDGTYKTIANVQDNNNFIAPQTFQSTITASAGVALGGYLKAYDSINAYFGTGNDFRIVYDGVNALLDNNNTGSVYIRNFADAGQTLFYNSTALGVSTHTLNLSSSKVEAKVLFEADAGILLPDSQVLRLGNSDDLRIYHDGTHSYIHDNGAGLLLFRSGNTNVGFMDIDGFNLYDNMKFKAGSSGDLQIYHDGTDSYIHDNGTGALIHRVGSENIAYWRPEGLQFYDNNAIRLGAGADFNLYHNGSNNYLDAVNGDVYFRALNSGNNISFQTELTDGTVHSTAVIYGGSNTFFRAFHNNSSRLETSAAGIKVNASIGGNAQVHLTSNNQGTSQDNWYLRAQHSDKDFVIFSNTTEVFRLTDSSGNLSALGIGTFGGRVVTDEIRNKTGQQLVLSAGDAWSVATGQTGEYVYINAESGLQINASTDNWATGWAVRKTITIDSNGIWTSSDILDIQSGGVNGTKITFDDANSEINANADFNVTGDITATGNIISNSDKTLKKDIKTIENPLETVSKLRGVDYTWKESEKPGMGVIAQEIEEVLPNLVHENKEGVKSVSYIEMIALLIESNKALIEANAELAKRVEKLENKT